MTTTLSPKAAAQKTVDAVKSLSFTPFNEGRWAFNRSLEVVVLSPPRRLFVFAVHLPTLKFFRSASKTSTRLSSASIRSTIDPERSWLVDAMKSVVPDGADFLALERGDTSVLDSRAAARMKVRDAAKAADSARLKALAKERAAEAAENNKPPTFPSSTATKRRETPSMALLDIQTNTKRVIMEEVTHTLELDRKQLLAIIKSAGATTLKKNAKIMLASPQNLATDMGDTSLLRIEWSETREREESEGG